MQGEVNKRDSNEILILKRKVGLLKLHVPIFVYDPKTTHQLVSHLRQIDGVLSVQPNTDLAILVIRYNWMAVSERNLLLDIDKIASPALRFNKLYTRNYRRAYKQNRSKQWRKLSVSTLLIYLVWVHRWRLSNWFAHPLASLGPLTALSTLIYLHRGQLKGAWQSD